MPAALNVNWGEVRMLAVERGVREAARLMGLPEDAVRQRSSREGWLANLPRSQPLPPTMVRTVTDVTSGPKAQENAMREDSTQGRATVLRVARRAVARVERCDDDELLMPEIAGVLHQHTKTLALSGGWNAQTGIMRVNLTATASEGVTLEAEIVDGPDPLDVSSY